MHGKFRITALAQEEWNLHGRLLDENALRQTLRKGLPNILHATSSQSGHVGLFNCSLQQDFGKSYPVRLFQNPTLRQHQVGLLGDFLAREFPHLKGSDTMWSLAQAGAAGSRLVPNDPCPCRSGRKFKQCHGKGLR
jgi:hypothetical protein